MPRTAEERTLYRSDENKPLLIVWGAALRRARRRRGMTQKQLAANVGIDASTIGLLERGSCDGSLSLWYDIVLVLDIALEDIFHARASGDAASGL